MSVTVILDGFTMGSGTDYEVRAEGIQGVLGSPPVRSNDVTRGHADGSVAGYDYLDARLISIPVTVIGDTAADCRANIEALVAAWAPNDGLTTSSLTVTVWGKQYVFTVRPRGAFEDNLADLASGVALMTCEAFCPDPDPLTS